MARDVLHDRDGAFTDQRDRHRMGQHAVARDCSGRRMKPVPGRADEALLNVKQTGWMVEEDRWQRRISAGA